MVKHSVYHTHSVLHYVDHRLGRLIESVIAWLVELSEARADSTNEDAIDDDELDAWLDEDEIDATGL